MKHRLSLCVILLCASLASAETLNILSPNKELVLTTGVDEQSRIWYSVTCNGQEVILPSRLGLELVEKQQEHYSVGGEEEGQISTSAISLKADGQMGGLMSGFAIEDTVTCTFDETWTPVWGEEATIRNHYNELLVTYRQTPNTRFIRIRFRVFDEAVAFRYEFPALGLNYLALQ
ncbi:MAG: glycoside hydrolase family 97 N-terminal domain-containing protein, partial [Paludibacteraceae bacterium]|nr:glycoside hydrolase family 97 N-terminal domain-containing protein [Paludibacteraceae bacterium]